MILVNQVNDKIQVNQVRDGFVVTVNGLIVRKSEDLDTIENPTNEQIKQYMKTYRSLSHHQKANIKHQNRVEKARSMDRQRFIVSEVIERTRHSKEYKLIRRSSGKFDITFIGQPIWTNIEIDNIENWLERTGMREISQESSIFWTENQ